MDKKEYNRRHYLKNREKRIAASKAYYEANRDRLILINKENEKKRMADPAYKRKKLEKSKENYWKNRTYHLKWHREHWKKLREDVLIFVGGEHGIRCKVCCFDDVRALQIDHVNGGGRKEIVSFKDNKKYLEHIKKKPENYQILCANCNWIKKCEKNELKAETLTS